MAAGEREWVPSGVGVVWQGQHFDPDRWAADGFADRADSLLWSDRACGIACVAMVLDHAGVAHPGRAGLLHQARRAGGYASAGWLHRGLADLLSRYGVAAEPVTVPPPDLGSFLDQALGAGPVIASVALGLPRDGRRGGHLILLTDQTDSVTDGPDVADGGTRWVEFRDPSTWGRTHRRAELARVEASFSGRLIRTGRPVEVAADCATERIVTC